MPATYSDHVTGLTTSVAVKAPVRVATTAAITLSGLQTVGGVALASGDRVLVKNQTDTTQNGIYVASTGSWSRAKDFDGNRDVVRGTVVVANINNGQGLLYRTICTDPVVIDTSAITFQAIDDPNFAIPQTEEEALANITPTNFSYDPRYVERYGVLVDGSVDATDTLNELFEMGGRIWCGEQTVIRVDGALLLDISTTSLEGVGVQFDMSNGGTLQVFSSADYSGRVLRNWTHKVKGIAFFGDSDVGHTGVTIGRVGASYVSSSEIRFEDCSFSKFDTNIAFTDNAWRTSFLRCSSEQCRTGGRLISFPSGLTNAGEVMLFDHCWLVDATTASIYIDAGHFSFRGCSFFGGGSLTLRGVTDARIDIIGCNMEAQASTGYRMLHLSGTCNCSITGGQIVINEGTNWEVAPFLLDSADASVTLTGVHMPLAGAHLDFEVSDVAYTLRHWFVGPGRVVARGIASYSLSSLSGPGNNTQLAKTANLLSNGDAEYGNENGWTKTAGGGATGTAVASTSADLLGTYGFRLTAPNGTDDIVIHQDVTLGASVGGLAILSFAVRVVSGTGTVASMSLRFLDQAGNPITAYDRSDTASSSDTTYVQKALIGIVPPGAHSVRAQFAANPTASGNVVDFDEICLCVI